MVVFVFMFVLVLFLFLVRMMETVEVRALFGIRICVDLAGTREIRAHTGGDRLEEALAEWFGHDMVDVLELDLQGGLMRGKCAVMDAPSSCVTEARS